MLESTVWRQYNSEDSLRERLSECSVLAMDSFIEDSRELYAVVKSKLTKKELKLFSMDSASVSDEEMREALTLNEEELKQAKFKLYKKLKQDKTRLSFRASN